MTIRIALAGNPNAGKTTLFNALTGARQSVGNWPGVTVEKKEGRLKNRPDVTVTDLPGIYSLSPYSLEEIIARNYLLDEKPDVILNIVDGTNLERNLYLTTQLLELGIPVVVAINMRMSSQKAAISRHELAGKRTGWRGDRYLALKETGVAKRSKKRWPPHRIRMPFRSRDIAFREVWNMHWPILRKPSFTICLNMSSADLPSGFSSATAKRQNG